MGKLMCMFPCLSRRIVHFVMEWSPGWRVMIVGCSVFSVGYPLPSVIIVELAVCGSSCSVCVGH